MLLFLVASQLGGNVADDLLALATEVPGFPIVRVPLVGSRVEALFVAMRSTRRVGDLAINDIDYLKMRQKEIEQRNPDAAEMVAAVVNGVNVAIVHRARQYAIELGG